MATLSAQIQALAGTNITETELEALLLEQNLIKKYTIFYYVKIK